MDDIFIIAINPGSTSTKIAVYHCTKCIFEENIKHSTEELAPFEKITDQFDFRKQTIMKRLNPTPDEREKVRVIMGRGGLVRPIESGVYTINEKMKHDLVNSPVGEHASNLGAFIAEDLAKEFPNSVAYITDPVVVDVNHAIGGEGPFSPERSGSVPVIDAVRLAYSGKYTEKEFTRMLIGQGGLAAHLGTNNAYEVRQRVIKGDKHAALIYEAMAYQVAKIIGEMATVLKGQVDGILITGGVAYDNWFVDKLRERAGWIGPFFIYPGENEMEALAMNALRTFRGEVEVKEYK